MIRKSVQRLSEKIMRNQKSKAPAWHFSRKLQDKKPMPYIGL